MNDQIARGSVLPADAAVGETLVGVAPACTGGTVGAAAAATLGTAIEAAKRPCPRTSRYLLE